jgi:hypothetical protein
MDPDPHCTLAIKSSDKRFFMFKLLFVVLNNFCCPAIVRQLGQEIYDRTAWAGWPTQISLGSPKKVWIGQAGQDSRNKTAGIGQPGQELQDRSVRTREKGQNILQFKK